MLAIFLMCLENWFQTNFSFKKHFIDRFIWLQISSFVVVVLFYFDLIWFDSFQWGAYPSLPFIFRSFSHTKPHTDILNVFNKKLFILLLIHPNPVNTRRYLDVDSTFFGRYGRRSNCFCLLGMFLFRFIRLD